MADAVAKAAEVPAVEGAAGGDVPAATCAAAAQTALRDGVPGLRAVGLVVGRPVQPMLAGDRRRRARGAGQAAAPAALEWKLDGDQGPDPPRRRPRVQVFTPQPGRHHRPGCRRRSRWPGRCRCPSAGSWTARPSPWPPTAGRGRSRRRRRAWRRARRGWSRCSSTSLPLEDEDLLDAPLRVRDEALRRAVPDDALRVARVVTDDVGVAREHFAAALAAGHEGVVAKDLDAVYAAGRRGAGVAEGQAASHARPGGAGRRVGARAAAGWLSNLHLGARAVDGSDGFVMLGKTFKGLTDELLAWQTEQLGRWRSGRGGDHRVRASLELVVEIAFDGVQTSPRYPGGVALRFARVLRYREDKRPDEADDLNAVLALRAGS